MRVNLTTRRSSVCSLGNIGVHSYRLSLESRHRREDARCFNIEHAEVLLREALQSSIVFVVSIYGINSILHARTGHARKQLGRNPVRRRSCLRILVLDPHWRRQKGEAFDLQLTVATVCFPDAKSRVVALELNCSP